MKLGLIGEPSAGKDSVADFLVMFKGFTRFAFADKIKEEYYTLTNYSEKLFKEKRGSAREREIRSGLWKYSDEQVGRYGKLHFILPVIKAIDLCENAVITDIRTPDELEQAKENKIKIIYVYKDAPTYRPNDLVAGSRIKYKDMCRAHFISLCNDYPDLDSFYKFLEEFYKRFLE